MYSTTEVSNFPQLRNLLCWSNLFGGTVIVIALTAILHLLGIALGFNILSYSNDINYTGMSMGLFIWLAITTIVALFAGGFFSGLGIEKGRVYFLAPLQAIIIWALSTIVTVTLATSGVGSLLSGATNLTAGTLTMMGNAAPQMNVSSKDAQSLYGNLKETISNKLEGYKIDPASTQTTVIYVQQYLNAKNQEEKDAVRKKIVTLLSENSQMTAAEANDTLTKWEQSYEQLKNTLIDSARSVSSQVMGTFYILVLINLLGAAAAIIGSVMGAKCSSKHHIDPVTM